VVALLPDIPLIALLVGIQVFNGILLPIILAFIVVLASRGSLMGRLRNSPLQTTLGWATLVVATLSVALLLLSQVLGFN
jgi:Mn2+/Fe2+ NRAMP family transporter